MYNKLPHLFYSMLVLWYNLIAGSWVVRSWRQRVGGTNTQAVMSVVWFQQINAEISADDAINIHEPNKPVRQSLLYVKIVR